MKPMPRFFPAGLPRPNAALLLAGLTLALPRSGRAEDALSYKYEDYRESGGRIAVQTQSAHLEQDPARDLGKVNGQFAVGHGPHQMSPSSFSTM